MEPIRLLRLLRAVDNVQGVGFLQHDTGRPTLCVAWEKGEPKKYDYTNPSDLEGVGVEIMGDGELSELSEIKKEASPEPAPEPTPEPETNGDPEPEPEPEPQPEPVDEAAAIEAYLTEHGLEVTNKSVVEALKEKGIVVQSAQVTAAKEKLKAA